MNLLPGQADGLIEDTSVAATTARKPVAAVSLAAEPGDVVSIQAVTASFVPSTGTLSVVGDSLDNNTTLSRDAAGRILVNNGAVAVTGGTPTVANTALLRVFGLAGNDTITLNEANGALPAAQLFGGAGNDVLTGGSGADLLFGQDDNDTLLGKGGNDQLYGGAGNDVLTGGDADDQMFGEAGDDRFIWNPGDDTDLAEGGSGFDTLEVNGGGGAEVFTVTANGTRVRLDRLDPAPFAVDAGTIEKIELNLNGGDDRFSATGNLAALVQLRVDGGAGNDTILGSNGADTLLGGDGNDFIDGQQGNDVAFLGAGEDVFQWDPGDGSDVVEGGAGTDTMLFNGSAGAEIFNLSANGGRALFTRNLGNIVMDLDDVERVDLNALGGIDSLTVNDMTGTDVKAVNVNLSGTIGGTAGDAAADTVTANGRQSADNVVVSGTGTSYSITGLPASIAVTASEGANDTLVLNTLGGNDIINAAALAAGVTRLTIDAGAGNDTVNGSQGADVIFGGDGNDLITGDNGNDTAFMGAGDDTFVWAPGDGNDVVEGQAGNDTLRFIGANVAENIDIAANGGRAIFFRNVANVTMDLDDVETIRFEALGGVDNITVGDMSGTDVKTVVLDLTNPNGVGGDGALDTATVAGSNAADTIVINTASDGLVSVTGLAARVDIEGADTSDRLVINALGGDDVVNASGLQGMSLSVNGGLGNDVMIGSAGDDLFVGGDGNDTALMGAGDDTFVWNPGDDNDTIEGQAGNDTMLFNGANVAENINIFANGGRALFFRDVANVLMDNNDVEVFDFNALGGADNITVGDMSGTDVTRVNLDLAAAGGAPDGAADTVNVQGTAGDDFISLSMVDGALVVDGLASQVVIEHFDPTLDTLRIFGLGGDDVIDASNLPLGSARLVLDGGLGSDVLLASADGSTLLGAEGDDILLGSTGNDVLDGGAGDNIVIGGGGNDVVVGSLVAQPIGGQVGLLV